MTDTYGNFDELSAVSPANTEKINAPLRQLSSKIGKLSESTTDVKTSLQAEINEIDAHADSVTSEVVTARASYDSLDQRLDSIVAFGGNIENQTDTIDELTVGHGVIVETVTLKDGLIKMSTSGSTYIELAKTGRNDKVAIGALGTIEANVSYNMDYSTGVHKYYDSNYNANWLFIGNTGMGLQYAPSGHVEPGIDIWDHTGDMIPWQVYSLGKEILYGAGQALSSGSWNDAGDMGATIHIKESTSSSNVGKGGSILFGAGQGTFAFVHGSLFGSGGPSGGLEFGTRGGVGENIITRMEIDHLGNIGVGTITLGVPSQRLEIIDKSVLGGESLTNGALTSGTSWASTGDCSLTGNAAVWTYSAGVATLTQLKANMTIAGHGSRYYAFTYTVSGVSGSPTAQITTIYASALTNLNLTAGTHTLYFKAAASPDYFRIQTTLLAGQAFTLDDLSLKEIVGGNILAHGVILGGGSLGLKVSTEGYVGVDTEDPVVAFDVNSDSIRVRTAKTPATAGATGYAGQICWDASNIYVCTATNTWKKVAIATW